MLVRHHLRLVAEQIKLMAASSALSPKLAASRQYMCQMLGVPLRKRAQVRAFALIEHMVRHQQPMIAMIQKITPG
jgi:hypothetical protein